MDDDTDAEDSGEEPADHSDEDPHHAGAHDADSQTRTESQESQESASASDNALSGRVAELEAQLAQELTRNKKLTAKLQRSRCACPVPDIRYPIPDT